MKFYQRFFELLRYELHLLMNQHIKSFYAHL